MVLKPQDIVVVLKLVSYGPDRPPFAKIAASLAISSSEVHAAVKRATSAHLLSPLELGRLPMRQGLEEFLIHGVKYAFPAERGEMSRGIPTSYAAPPLSNFIAGDDGPPPVWPFLEGTVRGVALRPLYRTVPIAAQNDPILYECLALVDAIRDGRARERNIAEQELIKILRKRLNE